MIHIGWHPLIFFSLAGKEPQAEFSHIPIHTCGGGDHAGGEGGEGRGRPRSWSSIMLKASFENPEVTTRVLHCRWAARAAWGAGTGPLPGGMPAIPPMSPEETWIAAVSMAALRG